MNKYEILEEFKEYLNYSNVIKKVENFIFKKTNQYKLDELETIELMDLDELEEELYYYEKAETDIVILIFKIKKELDILDCEILKIINKDEIVPKKLLIIRNNVESKIKKLKHHRFRIKSIQQYIKGTMIVKNIELKEEIK